MKLNSCLLFLFCCSRIFAQVNSAFIAHLSANQLFREHRAYLNSLPKQNDSTLYFETRFNLQYFNDSLFLKQYAACSGLCAADTAMTVQADKAFLLNNRTGSRDAWFTSLNTQQKTKSDQWYHNMYKASLNPGLYSKEAFPAELQVSFSNYKKAFHKKPALGAAFSCVIPGLGKLYAGKPKSALLTFLLNAGYAAQTIESGDKLGVKHPFTIVNAALFTVFYLANVYGGYADIVTLKRERKKQFLNDAAGFYN